MQHGFHHDASNTFRMRRSKRPGFVNDAVNCPDFVNDRARYGPKCPPFGGPLRKCCRQRERDDLPGRSLDFAEPRSFAIARGFGEPVIRPTAPFGSVALSSRTCSRVSPAPNTRAAFSASSAEMVTVLPGATRILFMPGPSQHGTLHIRHEQYVRRKALEVSGFCE